MTTAAALTAEETAKIKPWLDDAIDDNYATRMGMPLEQQKAQNKLFPVVEKEVPFAEGVQMLKYAASHDSVGQGIMNRDLLSIFRDGSVPLATYDKWRKVEKPEKRQSASLYAALIEASTGFYTLTEEEFSALKAKYSTPPQFSKAADVTKELYRERPIEALSKVSLPQFKALVAEVLAEKGVSGVPQFSDPITLTVATEDAPIVAQTMVAEPASVSSPVVAVSDSPIAPAIEPPVPAPAEQAIAEGAAPLAKAPKTPVITLPATADPLVKKAPTELQQQHEAATDRYLALDEEATEAEQAAKRALKLAAQKRAAAEEAYGEVEKLDALLKEQQALQTSRGGR